MRARFLRQCYSDLVRPRRSTGKPRPIPDRFATLAEAGEFWDSADLADYEGQATEVGFEVDLQRRTFLTALEPELAKRVSDFAAKQGVSAETLINLWLGERLAAATARG